MLINNTCIQNVSLKSHRHKKHWLGSYMDLFSGKTSHFLRIVPGEKKRKTNKKKNGFLVTAHEHHKWLYWDKKKLKKRQIKNSFVECLVTFTVYHRFLTMVWVVYMRNVSEKKKMYCKLCNVCKVSLILRVYIHGSRNVFKVI